MNDSKNNINNNIFEHVKSLKEVLEAKEYRRMLAVVSASTFVAESFDNGDKFTRRDIQNHVGNILKSEGFENYTYEFFRSW